MRSLGWSEMKPGLGFWQLEGEQSMAQQVENDNNAVKLQEKESEVLLGRSVRPLEGSAVTVSKCTQVRATGRNS